MSLILPVDANPAPIVRLDGQFWRPRVAGDDAPFSLEKSGSFRLHVNSQPSYIRGQSAQPTFRDNTAYWFEQTADGRRPGDDTPHPAAVPFETVAGEHRGGVRCWRTWRDYPWNCEGFRLGSGT